MSEIKIEQIDDDGFLLGDNEQTPQDSAENALLKAVQEGNTAIVSILRETQGLQRDILRATQEASKTRTRTTRIAPPVQPTQRVNLVHPNRQPVVNNQSQRVNLNHPNRPPINQSRVNLVHPNRPPVVLPVSDLNTERLNPSRINESSNEINNPTQADDPKKPKEVSAAERSVSSRLADSLKDLNNNLTLNANTDRIDPMIDAIKEVGDIASVGIDAGKKALSVSNTLIAKPALALGRGIKGLFKPKTDAINSPTAWYKRIWRTLERGNRQDQTQHLQEQRRLDELVRGQGQRGSADSGFLMMLGLGIAALLAAIKNIKFPSLDDIKEKLKTLGTDNQSPVPVVKVPKVNSTIIQANPALKWLSETKVGQTISKFLKRLPFISSAIEAGAGGINAINIANDANLTEEQKQRKQSENAGQTGGAIVGGLGGATAGAALGAKLGLMTGNPIIAAVGGVVGGLVGGWLGTEGGRIVGSAIGGWVDDLRKVDIAGRMTNAWNGFIKPLTPMFSSIKDTAVGAWQSVVTKAKETWEKTANSWHNYIEDVKTKFGGIMAGFEAVGDFFANVGDVWNTWIKKATGIDVKENLKQSKQAIGKQIDKQIDKANDYAGQKLDQAGQFVDDVGQAVKNTPLVQGVMGLWNGLTGEISQEKANEGKNKNKKPKKPDASTQNYYNKNKDFINDAANRFNVSPEFLTATAFAESRFKGGDIKNPKTTATGMFQVVEDTWAWQIAKSTQPEALPYQADAKAYLADKNKGMSREKRREKYQTLLAARNNNKLNAVIGAQYARDALTDFKKKGISNPTGEEIYAYHHDGNLKRVIAARSGNKDAQAQLEIWRETLADGATYYNHSANTFAQQAAATPTPAAQTAKPTAKTQTTTIPTAKAISAPTPSINANQVPVVKAEQQPMRVNNAPPTVKVSIAKPLVGQNMSDRGIAHIVTGGIGETYL